jgi:hypothetical protein
MKRMQPARRQFPALLRPGLTILVIAGLAPLPAHASFENALVTGVNSDFRHLSHVATHAGHVIQRETITGAHHVARFTTHTARQIEADVK